MRSKLIVANASGFFGDRFAAPAEVVRGGPIDVLTGDYLSELTMAILHRQRERDPNAGWVASFVKQIQPVLGECLARGIKIVTNAGGLNPRGLKSALAAVAAKAGLSPKIAVVEGDDITARMDALRAEGERFIHLDTREALDPSATIVTANVYLGARGIRRALDLGADVVICGRVTDAALAVGPAAWAFEWKDDDWDRLAGAVVAGHILECGTQATGGNYSFFEEIESFIDVGFPLAEMFPDGSCVITKHPGTGGRVNVGTVTAQLLYEIQGPRYFGPDVIARFDTIRLAQEAPDRVRVEGTRGEPAPQHLKVSINLLGGYKNSMTIVISGLDVEVKANIVRDMLDASLGPSFPLHTELIRSDRPDPKTNHEACASLRVTAIDKDRERVGRRFSNTIVELLLAGPPGLTLTGPPEDATAFFVHYPALIDRRHIEEKVEL